MRVEQRERSSMDLQQCSASALKPGRSGERDNDFGDLVG